MSSEGYYEYLCDAGHHAERDQWAHEQPTVCPVCGKPFTWRNRVDETNGVLEGCPETKPAPVEQIGEEVFMATRPLFRPVSGWTAIKRKQEG